MEMFHISIGTYVRTALSPIEGLKRSLASSRAGLLRVRTALSPIEGLKPSEALRLSGASCVSEQR